MKQKIIGWAHQGFVAYIGVRGVLPSTATGLYVCHSQSMINTVKSSRKNVQEADKNMIEHRTNSSQQKIHLLPHR